MKALPKIILTGLAIAASSCSSLETNTRTTADHPQSAGEIAFDETVKPLIEKRCVWCHRNRKALAGLNFQDRAKTLDPTLRFIVPGQPDQSRIYTAITRENAHPRMMPGDGWSVTSEQKAAMRQWIDDGAPWPDGRDGKIHRKKYQIDQEDYL